MQPNACSIALFDGESIFLIQRAYPPAAGLWTLPGGRRESTETPEDCVRRELFEETGLVVTDLIEVMTEAIGEGSQRFRLAVFAAIHPMRAPVISDEIANWEWVRRDEIWRYRTTPHLAEVVDACAAKLRFFGHLA